MALEQKPGQQTRRPLMAFVCHASEDRQAAHELAERLRASGYDAWIDKDKLLPGHDWEREIRLALQAADVVIVCLSRTSIGKTGFVQKELKYALDLAQEHPEGDIFVVPARLETCAVPERLKPLQRVDLFERDGYERLAIMLKLRADARPDLLPVLAKHSPDSAIDRELVAAQVLHAHLVSTQTPSIPGLEVSIQVHQCNYVAGDYCNVMKLATDRVAVIVTDTAGKGLMSSMRVARLQVLIDLICRPGRLTPKAVIREMNDALRTSETQFTTTFYGELNLQTKELIYVNAGHNPPALIHTKPAQGTSKPDISRLEDGGPVMGLFPSNRQGMEWSEGRVTLAPGEILAIWTDGLPEAPNDEHEEFGDSAIIDAIFSNETMPLEAIAEAVMNANRAWCGYEPQFDDQTLVLLRMSSTL